MMHQAVAANPPWAARLLKQRCSDLMSFTYMKHLPYPVEFETGCEPGPELGCGHYGCVYATKDPGIVIKLTSDPTEAFFVACYMKLRDELLRTVDSPEYVAIVDYKGILPLSGQYRRRDTYLIWREAAEDVGNWWDSATIRGHFIHGDWSESAGDCVYFEQAARETTDCARAFMAGARLVRDRLLDIADDSKRFEIIAAQRNKDYAIDDLDWHWGAKIPSWLRGNDKIGYGLELCRLAAELLENENPIGQPLGSVLTFFLEHGLLLADVHHGNLGVRRGQPFPIITDPGHVVPLTPEWEAVTVETEGV